MENTVVGVYDDKAQAQGAMNELLASGFSRNNVQMNPEHMPTAAARTDTGHGIGHFFRTLFAMGDADRNTDVYAEAVRRGSVVLVVAIDTDDERDRAMVVMNRYNPVDIDERSTHWRSQGWSSFDTTAPMMSEDEILQDRSRYAASPSSASAGGVRAYQRASEPSGTDDTDYRRHWQTAYGSSGGRYEDYDDAYRYGSTLSGTERFRNYRWDDVEPDVRRDWESSHPGSAWENVKDAVRYGAERVTGGTRH